MTEHPTKVNVSKRHCRRQRGQSLVEFALILPLLLLLIAAVADFARAFHIQTVITNAAREGAKFASEVPYREHEDLIRSAASKEARNSGIDLTGDDANITVTGLGTKSAAPGSGDAVTVTVEYTMTTIFVGIIGLDELPIRSESKMIIFGFDSSLYPDD